MLLNLRRLVLAGPGRLLTPIRTVRSELLTPTGQLRAGAKPEPGVYSSLLDSGSRGGEHAACFAELRRNFVNARPTKLKNLILLVKHWYRQVRPLVRVLAAGI